MAKVLKITLKTELIWKINSIRAVKSESMTNRKNNFSVKREKNIRVRLPAIDLIFDDCSVDAVRIILRIAKR